MFQMTVVAPQTHLKPTSEVVNHPDTLFLPDGTNLLGDGHFQFSDGLRTILIHVVLQEPPEIKNLVSEAPWRSFRICAVINEFLNEFVVPVSAFLGCFFKLLFKGKISAEEEPNEKSVAGPLNRNGRENLPT